MMAVTFAVALKAGKHSVVDTAWGIGIAVAAAVSLLSSLGYGQPARRACCWPRRSSGACGWPSTSARATAANPRTRATVTC
jgi:hypothetical protein